MKKIIEIHPHKLKDLWVFFQGIYKKYLKIKIFFKNYIENRLYSEK